MVVSKGPGAGSQPVIGGTTDVQILTYDPLAQRWVLIFDAADPLINVGWLDEPVPLFDQTHPVDDVQVQAVEFAGQEGSDLVISGIDADTNHPGNDVAVLRVSDASVDLLWHAAGDQGVETPEIVGEPGSQTVEITADYVPELGAACCPARTYLRSIGPVEDSITVVADDRPYLGAWVDVAGDGAPNTVIAVDASGPAAGVLLPGDQLLAIDDQAVSKKSAGSWFPAGAALAHQHAGDQVTVRFLRDTKTITVTVTLASMIDAPEEGSVANQQAKVGSKVDGDLFIQKVDAGSPAAVGGLQIGDQIVAIDGVHVSDFAGRIGAMWGTGNEEVAVTRVPIDPTSATEISVLPYSVDTTGEVGRL